MLFIENTGSVCEREPLSIKLLPLNLNRGRRNAKDVLYIFVALYCVMSRQRYAEKPLAVVRF